MTSVAFYQLLNKSLTSLNLFAPLRLGGTDLGERSIGIIPLPRAPGSRYADGSRMASLAFDVQCKSPQQAEAFAACERIADYLEGKSLAENSVIEVYTEPHFAYRADHEVVYSAMFYAEFLKG